MSLMIASVLSFVAVWLAFPQSIAKTLQWEVNYQSGLEACKRGQYTQAKRLLESALESTDLDSSDLRRDEIEASLASVYQLLGDVERAQIGFHRVQGHLCARGNPDPTVAWSIFAEIAVYYQGQGQLEVAELLLQRAVACSRKAFGEEHPNTATAESSLAQIYMDEGRITEARTLLEHAVGVHRRTLPVTNVSRITTESTLGTLSMLQGRYLSAQTVLQDASEAARALGEQHPIYGDTLVNLADLYRAEGVPGRSAPLLRKALNIYEQAIGPECSRVAEVLLDMSLDSLDEHASRFAEGQILRALLIMRKIHGPDHTTVAVGEFRLARALIQQKHYGRARQLLEHAFTVQAKTYPKGHFVVADCLHELAELSVLERRYLDADQYYQKALTAYESSVSPGYLGRVRALQEYVKLIRRVKVIRAIRPGEVRVLNAQLKQAVRESTSIK